jgi:urease accessory protein
MVNAQSAPLRSWRAQLALEFERRAARTVLSGRRRASSLVIQKPLSEDGVCHAIIVHPPGSIAETLELSADLGAASARSDHTRGDQGYRSAGAWSNAS